MSSTFGKVSAVVELVFKHKHHRFVKRRVVKLLRPLVLGVDNRVFPVDTRMEDFVETQTHTNRAAATHQIGLSVLVP